MAALKLEICSTVASSVPCMSDLRIEGSPAPGKESRQAAEQLVLRSKQSVAETPTPVFSFFGGETEEEEPEISVTENQKALPTATPLVDSEPPQDFLDSITEEVIKTSRPDRIRMHCQTNMT